MWEITCLSLYALLLEQIKNLQSLKESYTRLHNVNELTTQQESINFYTLPATLE